MAVQAAMRAAALNYRSKRTRNRSGLGAVGDLMDLGHEQRGRSGDQHPNRSRLAGIERRYLHALPVNERPLQPLGSPGRFFP